MMDESVLMDSIISEYDEDDENPKDPDWRRTPAQKLNRQSKVNKTPTEKPFLEKYFNALIHHNVTGHKTTTELIYRFHQFNGQF